MLTELTYALKGATRSPGFFLLAALTLAAGIGANGAVFSLMDAIYFRPLPLEQPDELVRIEATSPKAFRGMLSYLEAEEIAATSSAFIDVVVVGRRGVTLHQGDDSHLLLVDYVSEDFFDAMGLPLQMGHGFPSSPNSAPQVIINHQLWQEHLGGREDVVGTAIRLNDTLFTVAAVTPNGFVGLDRVVRTDVWVMAAQAPFVVPRLRDELTNRHQRWFDVYARLSPDAGAEQAQTQLDAIAERWGRDDPEHYPRPGFRLLGVSDDQQERMRDGMIFLALPGLVLLIACANVANLLLARSERRRRELAIRAAIGAGRARILRQLVAESLVLVAAGTMVGLIIALWLIQLVPALVPPGALTYTIDARFDLRMLLFCAGLLSVATISLVAAQASRVRRPRIVTDLRSDAASVQAVRARFSMQHLIVGTQTAVGVVVLVATALMVRSLWYSSTLRPGFDRDRELVSFYLAPSLQGYGRDETYDVFEQLRERMSSLPSVLRVSYAIRLPAQDNEAGWSSNVVVHGVEPPLAETAFRIRYTMVGPDYFDVLGTRILRGRGIEVSDRPESRPVVIINESMAARFWPDADPIGETIAVGGEELVDREIVGVAENIKISDLYEEPEMYLYLPYAQDRQGFGLLLVETALDPEGIARAAIAEIARVAPDVSVLESGSLRSHMALVLFEERRDAWIAIGIGLLALALTAGGIYGLVTMVTSHRTKEIGIRVVLGASRTDVLWLVIRRGLGPAGAGSIVGIAIGLVGARYLESRIHGIDPLDPVSFAAGVGILIVAVVGACVVPARRAARTEPSETMRYE